MKKKIAFVVAVPGTARSFLKDHMTQLVQHYDVHLLANFQNDKEKDEFIQVGVKCLCIPIRRKISLWNDLKALLAIYEIFKRERFDCVHSVTPKAALLNAMAGWLAKIPHRIHIYTGQVWATREGIMRTLLKGMDKIPAWLNTDLLVDGVSQRRFLIKEGVLKESNSKVLANGSIAGVRLERFVISEDVRACEVQIYR